VVVVVRDVSCDAADFACLVADPPRSLCVSLFCLCGGGGGVVW